MPRANVTANDTNSQPTTAVRHDSVTPWHTHHYLTETRHYTALLHQDLFGQWILTKIWGARGSRLGRVVDVPCRDYAQGLERLEVVGRKRRARGYERLG